jgi:hypothetical protein
VPPPGVHDSPERVTIPTMDGSCRESSILRLASSLKKPSGSGLSIKQHAMGFDNQPQAET